MFEQIFELVENEFSGENAKNLASHMTQFHRIPVSPHYRKAAAWCKEQLREYGLAASIHKYLADSKTMYWSYTLPEEWEVESAALEIDGAVWAQFKDKKISLIQRSYPVDVEAEVVPLKREDLSCITGKIVYSPLPPGRIIDVALHYKAHGIITSGSGEAMKKPNFPDAIHYFSFWGEKGSGFVLSPRKGKKLEKMLQEKPVKAKMVIKSRLYPGHLDVIEAFIPGETTEEVLVVAHLCHPQPSANDNASGCAVLMETARTLQELIGTTFRPPVRGIRFLLVPEIIGTVAYLASNQEKIDHVVAGINLDMVGENQRLCRSTLLLVRTPDALSSFVNDLAEVILDELGSEVGTYPPFGFKYGVTSFSGVSDHYVLSDPSVGIPCPMVIQWPDFFYHTSLDTPDNLDPVALKRAGKLAAAYVYFVAYAGEKEAARLAPIIVEKGKERIAKKIKETARMNRTREDKLDLNDYLDYLLQREILTLRSLKKLADITTEPMEEELRYFVEKEKEKEKTKGKQKVPETKTKEECKWIPKKIYPGPISLRKVLLEMSFEEKNAYKKKMGEYPDSTTIGDVAGHWVDGKRTLSQINRQITYEVGKSSLEFLKWYFQFLETHQLVTLER